MRDISEKQYTVYKENKKNFDTVLRKESKKHHVFRKIYPERVIVIFDNFNKIKNNCITHNFLSTSFFLFVTGLLFRFSNYFLY